MYQVCAVKNHSTKSFIIKSKDGVHRLVKGTTTESELVEILNSPSIDEWETNFAEEELACLLEELDNTNYENNSAKNLRQ